MLSILVSASSLSFSVDTDGDGIDDSVDVCSAFNGNGSSAGKTEVNADTLRLKFCAMDRGGIPNWDLVHNNFNLTGALL